MRYSTRIACVAVTSCVYAVVAGGVASSAPAPTTVEVVHAKLQADGSVSLQTKVVCPAGDRFVLDTGFTQETESQGSFQAAVAYSAPVSGTCSGRAQRSSTQTTPSTRAPFVRDFGRQHPVHDPHRAGDGTNPTAGFAQLTVTSRDGVVTSYSAMNELPLR